MDDDLKARFRIFADQLGDDDVLHPGGLTGRDIKKIAAKIQCLVSVRYASLDELAAEVVRH